jgi:hypothetical protein
MSELELAAAREENGRLKAAVKQMQRTIVGIQERDRVGAIEVSFIGAALARCESWSEESLCKAVEVGRKVARLYVDMLVLEVEKGDGDEVPRAEDSGSTGVP